jgi:hypothetical protein
MASVNQTTNAASIPQQLQPVLSSVLTDLTALNGADSVADATAIRAEVVKLVTDITALRGTVNSLVTQLGQLITDYNANTNIVDDTSATAPSAPDAITAANPAAITATASGTLSTTA